MNRHFPKENTDGTQAHDKMLHITHHRGMQIKTAVRHHFTPVNMAVIKKTTENMLVMQRKENPSAL